MQQPEKRPFQQTAWINRKKPKNCNIAHKKITEKCNCRVFNLSLFNYAQLAEQISILSTLHVINHISHASSHQWAPELMTYAVQLTFLITVM